MTAAATTATMFGKTTTNGIHAPVKKMTQDQLSEIEHVMHSFNSIPSNLVDDGVGDDDKSPVMPTPKVLKDELIQLCLFYLYQTPMTKEELIGILETTKLYLFTYEMVDPEVFLRELMMSQQGDDDEDDEVTLDEEWLNDPDR